MAGISIPKIENRAMKYGYSNARVKGMKGLLLTRQFLDELINIKKIEAIAELLQRTHYKEDINFYSVKYRDSALIELAAIKHFAALVKKLRKISPADDLAIVDALLKKWDLLNIKMIINARRAGRIFEDIKPYLICTGAVPIDEYEAIARADETMLFDAIKKTAIGQEMLSLSTAEFSREMWAAFRSALTNMNTFLQLQTILDTHIYLFMDKGLKSENKDVDCIRRILKKEIDAKNMLLIERLKAHGIDAKKIRNYLIRGGTLSDAFVSQLIETKELKDVIALLKTKFSDLPLVKKEGGEIASLVELEIALEKAVAKEKIRSFRKAVLSIGVVLGFLLLKEEEINNLRKIARAKEFGISEQDIKDMVIVV